MKLMCVHIGYNLSLYMIRSTLLIHYMKWFVGWLVVVFFEISQLLKFYIEIIRDEVSAHLLSHFSHFHPRFCLRPASISRSFSMRRSQEKRRHVKYRAKFFSVSSQSSSTAAPSAARVIKPGIISSSRVTHTHTHMCSTFLLWRREKCWLHLPNGRNRR